MSVAHSNELVPRQLCRYPFHTMSLQLRICRPCLPYLFNSPSDAVELIPASSKEPCLVCLAHDGYWTDTLPRLIVEAMSGRDPAISTFHLSLQLPYCLATRVARLQKTIRQHLAREQFMASSSPPDMKLDLKQRILPSLVPLAGLQDAKSSPYMVEIKLTCSTSWDHVKFLSEKAIRSCYPAKYKAKTSLQRLLTESRQTLDNILTCVPDHLIPDLTNCDITQRDHVRSGLATLHTPMYLARRYIKKSREISQSPWSFPAPNNASNDRTSTRSRA